MMATPPNSLFTRVGEFLLIEKLIGIFCSVFQIVTSTMRKLSNASRNAHAKNHLSTTDFLLMKGAKRKKGKEHIEDK